MLKYEEFLAESLAAEVKSEPTSAAAKEARKLGLTYMGFGRYADNKEQIAYLVDNDRLVPYKRREDVQAMQSKVTAANAMPAPKKPVQSKTGVQKPDKNEQARKEANFYNTVLNKRDREDSKILKQKDKETQVLNNALYQSYGPQLFSEDELNAINEYSANASDIVNRYLYKGHDDGITPEQDQYVNGIINGLDSAFEETQAPFSYTVYTGLSQRYNPDKIAPGGEYVFRGYLSSSIAFQSAIEGQAESGGSVVLQVEISKGQRSIYTDPMLQYPGDGETLLPRGSKIKVISGPHMIDDSIVSDNPQGNQIYLFHCQLMED
jgi:hypothetical protein